MKKFFLALTLLVSLIACGIIVTSCNNKEESYVDSKNSSLSKAQEGGGVTILVIMQGKRNGGIFTGKCEGTKGICVLLFPRNYYTNPIKDVTIATFRNIDNKILQLNIDYSMATNEEKSSWEEDIKNGYVELFSDIILTDKSFLEEMKVDNNIILPTGKYKIMEYDLEKESFEVEIPYDFI